MSKILKMVVEVNELTRDNITGLLVKMKKQEKRTLIQHFGKLKRGIDGLEYQKAVRNEWD